MADQTQSKPMHKVEYEKQQHKEEMKHQVLTFALMILFTLIAFGMVVMEVNSYFIIPTLIILAIVQVAFQLYYFMHMKNKGHDMVALMMYGGAAVALLTIITFTSIIWW
ncbi:cytochrome c oxidase subunit IVB [Halobacillus kuroshimensis]|uniref:Cytochrome c oxidase subunit IVB n=1 Tax=Halobacillus kuroshimensis TaxID=302481 RepID=A0ABS3DSJ9_9BACI|nr:MULTISPECIES: cytochrome c oxidase subunit IVB [Halobacillus]MBN8234317.1 cytochrome c oxidase subunit IVB [Halobacillus kuroshimensis]